MLPLPALKNSERKNLVRNCQSLPCNLRKQCWPMSASVEQLNNLLSLSSSIICLLICRLPDTTMQTFSANFCRCDIASHLSWPQPQIMDGKTQGLQATCNPSHMGILAISGSNPQDIELWSFEVIARPYNAGYPWLYVQLQL